MGFIEVNGLQGRIQPLSKVGVHIRHIITKGVGGHAPRQKYSAFPVNLTPLSRNNFVLWVEPLYIIFQGGVQNSISVRPVSNGYELSLIRISFQINNAHL